MRYVSPQVDSVTRQRQVVLSVEAPYQSKPRLFPNQQVQAVVNLGLKDNVVSVPLSVMTRDGYVWTLDNNDRLRKESVSLIGQGNQVLDIKFNQQSEQIRRVVQYPLSSMLIGKQVEPNFYQDDSSESMIASQSDDELIEEANQ